MSPKHSHSVFLADGPGHLPGFVHDAQETQVQLSNQHWGAGEKTPVTPLAWWRRQESRVVGWPVRVPGCLCLQGRDHLTQKV